jgi:exosome complex RNA-binding protein Rrp42 (RNase PH superfamily)
MQFKNSSRGQCLVRLAPPSRRRRDLLPLPSLCIRRAEAAWALDVDVEVINNAGCVFDAALISVISALHNSLLPRATPHTLKASLPSIDATSGACRRLQSSYPLSPSLRGYVLPVTFAAVGAALLIDPSADEEAASDHLLHVVYSADASGLATDPPLSISTSGPAVLALDAIAAASHAGHPRALSILSGLCKKVV